MNVRYEVVYHPNVQSKDIPKLAAPLRERIRKAIEMKLFMAPEQFGEPLRRTLKGYWKLRVGDNRVIYKVKGKTVLILRVGHRSEIYKK